MKMLSLVLNELYEGLSAFGADFWCMPPEEVRDER